MAALILFLFILHFSHGFIILSPEHGKRYPLWQGNESFDLLVSFSIDKDSEPLDFVVLNIYKTQGDLKDQITKDAKFEMKLIQRGDFIYSFPFQIKREGEYFLTLIPSFDEAIQASASFSIISTSYNLSHHYWQSRIEDWFLVSSVFSFLLSKDNIQIQKSIDNGSFYSNIKEKWNLEIWINFPINEMFSLIVEPFTTVIYIKDLIAKKYNISNLDAIYFGSFSILFNPFTDFHTISSLNLHNIINVDILISQNDKSLTNINKFAYEQDYNNICKITDKNYSACLKLSEQLYSCVSGISGARVVYLGGLFDSYGERCKSFAKAWLQCLNVCQLKDSPPLPTSIVIPYETFTFDKISFSDYYSFLSCGEVLNYPEGNKHGSCSNCGYEDGRPVLFIRNAQHYEAMISNITDDAVYNHFMKDQFFYESLNYSKPKFIFNNKTDFPACDRFIKIPTLIVDAVYLNNAYHFLIDTLLPIISYSIKFGIKPLLFLDIPKFQMQHFRFMTPNLDTYNESKNIVEISDLLRHFANTEKVYAKQLLNSLSGRTCFSEIQFGLDYTKTPQGYVYEYSRDDLVMVSNKFGYDKSKYEPFMNDHALEIMKIQLATVFSLQSFVYNHFNVPFFAPGWTILLINRRNTRKFTNFEEMKSICEDLVGSERSKLVYLEDFSFKDQIKLFSNTRIFVAVHGAGVSNIIFLPRGSVLILSLNVHNFLHKYLYSNIALSSGIHVIVMRQPEIVDINYYDESRFDEDVLIDGNQFHQVLLKAISLLNNNQNDDVPSFFVFPDLYDDDSKLL